MNINAVHFVMLGLGMLGGLLLYYLLDRRGKVRDGSLASEWFSAGTSRMSWTDQLAQFQDREKLLQYVLREAVRLTDSTGGNLQVLNRPDGQWVETIQWGESSQVSNFDSESWSAFASRVHAAGGLMMVEPGQGALEDEDRPVLAYALVWQGQSFGVISLWKEEGSKYSEADLLQVERFFFAARQTLAVQYVSSRLKRQEALLNSLQDVGSLLVEPRNLKDILDELLISLEGVLPFDSSSILLREEGDGVYLAASRGVEDEEKARRVIDESGEDLILINWSGIRHLYLPDVRKDPDWVWIPGTEHIRSWIGVGLFVKGDYIGTLNIDHHQVDAYGPGDVEIALAFADLAAAAIEYSRLLHETRISNQRLQVLYELNNKLAETLDPEEILFRALHLAQDALGGEEADYYHYDLHGEEVQLICSVSREDRDIELINDYLAENEDKSELGWVLENRQGIRISNVLEDDLWIKLPEVDAEVRSLITVPVFIDQTLSGAISVLHTEKSAFTQEHEELLHAIAQQIGLALNNANRFREVRRLLDLLEAHQQLQDHLFEHLPVGVLLLNDRFQVLSANLEGLSIMDVLQPGFDRKTVDRLGDYPIQNLLPYVESSRMVEIKPGPEDQTVFQVRIRRVETTESPHWVLMISDITREVHVEKAVQMQQRLATLGQFAAGITHDFNNIISSILVYADILERDPELGPENAGRVSVIREQSQRAAELIGQILDFSRRSVLTREPMDLIPFLKHTRELLTRVLSAQYPVNLKLPEKRKRLIIKGDQTGLQQSLMNLALNARDAMAEGGEILITASQIELDPYQEMPVPGMDGGEWVKLEVVDQGTGIPESDIPHIFEPFFTTKDSKQGTGLGLAQVYGIVKQHDGFIQVMSSQPGGTSFVIYLPVYHKGSALRDRSRREADLDGREQRVLVVEDEEHLREALWNFLEDSNYQVLSAGNGVSGLDILQQMGDQISLIISDVVMPGMGGVDMVQKARRLYPDLPVLFITGHQENLLNHELLQEPDIQLLPKPFSLDELVEVIAGFDLTGPGKEKNLRP